MPVTGPISQGTIFKGKDGVFASDRFVSEIFRANQNSAVVNEGGTVVIDVAGNDTAPVYGLDLGSVVITVAPAHGVATNNGDGTVTYTHDGSENFADSFAYTIKNNNGDTSNIATVNISINPVNDNAPVFTSPATANVPELTTLVHTVTATDVDNSPLTYSINGTGPDDSKFIITQSGVLSFASAPDFESPSDANGDNVYNVDVKVTDGIHNVVQSIAVTVTDVAENPVAANDAYTVFEGASNTLNVLLNDTDLQNDIDPSTVVVVSQPTNGTATANPDGTIAYVHNGSETTSDTFTYRVYDLNGNPSNIATVSLTVTPVNDAPVAVDDAFSVSFGTTTILDLAANDTDPENALDLTSIAVVQQPSKGSVIVNNDGTVTYTNTSTGADTDSFTYTIKDTSGATSNVGNVTITVTAVQSTIGVKAASSLTYNGSYIRQPSVQFDGNCRVQFRPQFDAANPGFVFIKLRDPSTGPYAYTTFIRVTGGVFYSFVDGVQVPNFYEPFVANDLLEFERVVNATNETYTFRKNGVDITSYTNAQLDGLLVLEFWFYNYPLSELTGIKYYKDGVQVPVIFNDIAQATVTLGSL